MTNERVLQNRVKRVALLFSITTAATILGVSLLLQPRDADAPLEVPCLDVYTLELRGVRDESPRTVMDPEVRVVLTRVLSDSSRRIMPSEKGSLAASIVMRDSEGATETIDVFGHPRWLRFRDRYFRISEEEMHRILGAFSR